MAKKPAKAAASGGGKAGGLNLFHRMLLVIAALLIIPISIPSLLIVCLGMLPTLGAALMERGPNRYAWLSVGGLNFAGVAPYLLDLWFKGHTMERALTSLADVFAWLVILGSAAFGWLLYLSMPPVVGAFLQVAAQRRIATLRANQRKLVDQWGPDVVGAPTP
jgi:hypothetical protein